MKKKILVVSDSNSVGGAEKYIENLANLLSDTYEFSVVGGLGIQFLDDSQHFKRIWSEKVSNRKPFSFVKLFLNAYRTVKPDIIHLNLTHPLSCVWIQIVCSFLGIRCVATLHIVAPYKRTRLVRLILKFTYAKKTLIFVSETGELALKQLLGIQPHQTRTIVNWINVDWFRIPTEENKVRMYQQYAFQTERRLVIFVGRFEEQKNLLALLDFGPWFRENDWQLIMIGEGSQEQAISQKIESLRIQDVVRVSPFVKNIRDYYWAADLFLLLSQTECTPLALLEAMACGVPCVVTNVGDMSHMILEEHMAISLQELDEKSLEAAIDDALKHTPTMWRNKVCAHYSAQQASDQYIAVYEQC